MTYELAFEPGGFEAGRFKPTPHEGDGRMHAVSFRVSLTARSRFCARSLPQSLCQRPERRQTDPLVSRARRRSAIRPCSPGDGGTVPRLQRSPGVSGGTGELSARVSLARSWRRICKPPRAARMDRKHVVAARRAARRKRLSSGCRWVCGLACRGEHGAPWAPSNGKLVTSRDEYSSLWEVSTRDCIVTLTTKSTLNVVQCVVCVSSRAFRII